MTGVSARTCNNPEMFIHFESKPAIVPSSEVEIFVGGGAAHALDNENMARRHRPPNSSTNFDFSIASIMFPNYGLWAMTPSYKAAQ